MISFAAPDTNLQDAAAVVVDAPAEKAIAPREEHRGALLLRTFPGELPEDPEERQLAAVRTTARARRLEVSLGDVLFPEDRDHAWLSIRVTRADEKYGDSLDVELSADDLDWMVTQLAILRDAARNEGIWSTERREPPRWTEEQENRLVLQQRMHSSLAADQRPKERGVYLYEEGGLVGYFGIDAAGQLCPNKVIVLARDEQEEARVITELDDYLDEFDPVQQAESAS